MTQELVDYSRTANADWTALAQTLKAQGKTGVGRYAVNDLSPNGRGISAAEYQAMTDAGLDTFVYWESSEGWMTGGFAAGVQAAQNAHANIVNAGMPASTPVYFACDFDAAPEDQAAIDDCLRGAASVIGFARVGLYAGYHVLLRAKQNKTAAYFCQTSAWSGGMLMEGVHLYQYDYNEYFAGTNCDLVRAYQLNYGQATPVVIEVEKPKVPTVPWGKDATGVQDLHGTKALAYLGDATARRDVPIRVAADSKSRIIAKVKQGQHVTIRGSVRTKSNRWALVEVAGVEGVGRCLLSALTGPWPVL